MIDTKELTKMNYRKLIQCENCSWSYEFIGGKEEIIELPLCPECGRNKLKIVKRVKQVSFEKLKCEDMISKDRVYEIVNDLIEPIRPSNVFVADLINKIKDE